MGKIRVVGINKDKRALTRISGIEEPSFPDKQATWHKKSCHYLGVYKLELSITVQLNLVHDIRSAL